MMERPHFGARHLGLDLKATTYRLGGLGQASYSPMIQPPDL